MAESRTITREGGVAAKVMPVAIWVDRYRCRATLMQNAKNRAAEKAHTLMNPPRPSPGGERLYVFSIAPIKNERADRTANSQSALSMRRMSDSILEHIDRAKGLILILQSRLTAEVHPYGLGIAAPAKGGARG
ncbi:hypothetical protein [Methylobacterium sp. yr668]|uniref:hypothetical protein n=1 Tax=Methylobacterium sp. yr668 TaxID=1761801 RepID=UPI0011150289|nr:hypothetical protein [Methylobacterium sp. yr668]